MSQKRVFASVYLILSTILVQVAASDASVASAAESVAKPQLASVLTEALSRGDIAAYKTAVEAWLDGMDRSVANLATVDRWRQLRKKPGYLHGLALAELLRVTGVENVAKVAATPSGRKFLAEFFADNQWLTMYLASGPVPESTPDGLATLRDIWLADRKADAAKYRHLATAVALVFHTEPQKNCLRAVASQDRNPLTPVSRYMFFKASHKAGKLRPLFDGLAAWELRWIVCAPVENEALAWLQENVNVPLAEFDRVCFIPAYRGVNDFGNTVQGPLFYAPSRLQCNWAEDVARHGGVCGALSTFGAFNAIAHGVPATPKGQPGHCAYAVRIAPGNWMPGFGGPDGGSAYDFWKDTFSYTWLADDAFTAADKMQCSMQLTWLARRSAAKGKQAAALANYSLALTAQPLNWPVWQEYVAACLAEKSLNKTFWQTLAGKLVEGMARHPQPMCDLLAQFEEKTLWPAMSPKQREAYFLKIHQTVAANQRPGWTPWDMPRALFERQAKSLGEQEAIAPFFGKALGCYVQHGHQYFIGTLIDWGTSNIAKTPRGREPFFTAIRAAMGQGEGMDDNLRRTLLTGALRAAEEARSREGFQLLSDEAQKYSDNGGALKLDVPAGGRLLSGDGLLYLSGFDGWDNPAAHRDVLRENGGFFHCQPPQNDKGGHAWVVVQLKETCTLTGLAVANRLSNQARCRSLRVYASTDEKTWTPIAETDNFGQQWKVDLRGKNLRARWLKIENTTPKSDAFHLRNLCVYGEATA